MAAPRGLSVTQLRLFLGLLFLALAVPTAVLIVQAQRQMQWEAFHQYQTLADELATRIDTQLLRLIAVEESRSYADYHFAVVAGDPAVSNFVQRSPLAQFPVAAELSGVLGYFEIDADGAFSTPLLPDAPDPVRWGLDAADLAQRQALRDRLFEILSRNQLVERQRDYQHTVAAREDVSSSPASADQEQAEGKVVPPTQVALDELNARVKTSSREGVSSSARADEKQLESKVAPPSQVAFDKLNAPADTSSRALRNEFGRVEDLKIEQNLEDRYRPAQVKGDVQAQQLRSARKERSAVPEPELPSNAAAAAPVRIFESELDPFEFSLLDSGHGVLFRKVWRDGRRTIQGLIVAQDVFLQQAIVAPFQATALAQMSDLVVAWNGDVLTAVRGSGGYQVGADDLAGELLYQRRLSAPLGEVQLLWTINRLPAGAGAWVVGWSGAILFGVLLLGFIALYRLGLRQITLARQQQDFVSAVSHELKTPLTSIRMYAEMLRAGWATEDKKRGYYDFIFDESERLSRLIANVLQLARLERNELLLERKPVAIAALMDMLRSKVNTQIEHAGFAVDYAVDPACASSEVAVDADAFAQILINLVDNALKFSASAERRAVEIAARPGEAHTVVWSVRDYGPGVPRAQMKKIFQLFYRSGSELTREAVGTGIGLALVRQLARAMGGDVDVVNRDPGAEFRLTLPS